MTTAYLIMAAAGAILAAWAFRQFKREQERRRMLARLAGATQPGRGREPGPSGNPFIR